jgi:hypothetical protein
MTPCANISSGPHVLFVAHRAGGGDPSDQQGLPGGSCLLNFFVRGEGLFALEVRWSRKEHQGTGIDAVRPTLAPPQTMPVTPPAQLAGGFSSLMLLYGSVLLLLRV